MLSGSVGEHGQMRLNRRQKPGANRLFQSGELNDAHVRITCSRSGYSCYTTLNQLLSESLPYLLRCFADELANHQCIVSKKVNVKVIPVLN
jgi:hypothetical protein